MATRMSVATGNFTTAGTWAVCDATSELDSEAATVTLSTSNTDGTAFTPGAITVDGIAVKLRTRASSPSGTITVTLRNSSAGSDVIAVTANISDLPANATDASGNPLMSGWIFFKFSSPQLLLVATNYLVRIATSANSQVTLYGSTTTNMSRQLRTTTTGAPGAGDKLLISGELTGAGALTSFTVTMENTAATVFGTEALTQSLVVSLGGTLTWGTTASTAYLLTIAGLVFVCPGGTWNQGTSGTRIPSTSSATLLFSVTTNHAGGVQVHGGTFNAYGHNGRIPFTTITSDAASGQAVVNVAAVTGWANNDNICLAPTTRVATAGETRVIQSIASLAVTVSVNLANLHHGSAALLPNAARGHVGNLTRNVKILGTDNTHRTFIYFNRQAVVVCDYVEFQWFGGAASPKQGIHWHNNEGAKTITHCSMWNCDRVIVTSTGWGNFTFSDNVLWNCDASQNTLSFATDTSETNWTISGNLIIPNTSGGIGLRLGSVGGTVTNNIAAGCGDSGLTVSCAGNASSLAGTLDGFEAYCCTNNGIALTATGVGFPINLTMSNLVCWRNLNRGLFFAGAFPVIGLLVDGIVAFGNGTANVSVNSTLGAYSCTIRDGSFNGETSFATTRGLNSQTALVQAWMRFENCTFGVTVDHTTSDIGFQATTVDYQIYLIDCILGSATPITSFTGSSTWREPLPGSFIRCERYDQTDNDHRTFTVFGRIQTDAAIVNSPSTVSERLTPAHATVKLHSASKIRRAASGEEITVSVAVRKSAVGDGTAYTGNQPRLIQKRNPAVGLDADVVLDTVSVAVGNWEVLTGTTAALADDGAVEFYIDCDGAAGWVNVDEPGWLFLVS